MRRLVCWVFFTLLTLLLATACNTGDTADLQPVEEEQIENVVKSYVVRDTNIPEYTVTIEESTDNWARVSLKPAETDGPPTFLYLSKQGVEPTIEVEALPGHEAEASSTTGWQIILGPQADFSEAELEQAGIPEEIR